MLDRGLGPIIGPDERHDVESASRFQEAVSLEKMESGVRETSLFLKRHRFGRLSSPPGLHFDENQSIAVSSDQVDFAASRSIASDDDAHARSSQEARGGAFAAVAESTTQPSPNDRPTRLRFQISGR